MKVEAVVLKHMMVMREMSNQVCLPLNILAGAFVQYVHIPVVTFSLTIIRS